MVFGCPRPSKTASEGPRRLPRGYLGPLGDVLSHLRAILGTRAFKIAPAGWGCCRGPRSWSSDAPNGNLFWEPFWDQIGPRAAKMGPRGPPRASKYRTPAFTKTLKNHRLFKVFAGPRPCKTASEEPRRLPRGYLGPLGTMSSHLGATLETSAF